MDILKKPVVLAVFLLASLAFLGSRAADGGVQSGGVWGGPEAKENNLLSEGALLAAVVSQPALQGMSRPELLPEPETMESLGSVRSQGSPFGASGGSGSPITYKVAKGDTLSGIASRFGVSVSTLVSFNPEVRSRSLRIGQEITVLPTAGILYQTKEGDTLESIAGSFRITASQLAEFNRASLRDGKLVPGATLLVPGVAAGSASSAGGRLLAGYFIRPVEGWSVGLLHERNAVDIANACGTPVVAAAEGLVLDAAEDGWNGGYGEYVYIEHPNDTRTRYAHLSQVAAAIGDYLKQGDGIGEVGRSGEASGCHLHFEVEGAANPFAR